MSTAKLVAIYVAPGAGGEMQGVSQVKAVAGKGLEGDRYFKGSGTFAEPGNPDREVTLIEREAIAAAEKEYDVALPEQDARRNLITEGVPLNHLVERTFQVGEVTLRGIRLCEPCGHLEKLTVKGIRKALVHRGGLRAQIVESGTLKIGDPVRA